ncbi:MAG: acetylxylan esterase [Bacteroidales bacterium]|nr:acetylxylan esterase [Bacteroidales bacterium]
MKKRIGLLLLLILVTAGYSQNVLAAQSNSSNGNHPAEQLDIRAAFRESDPILTGKPEVIIPLQLENTSRQTLRGSLSIKVVSDFGEEIFIQEKPIRLRPGRKSPTSFTLPAIAPGFYRATIAFQGELASKQTEVMFGYEPEKIVSPPNPQPDFALYWERAKRELAAVDPQYRMIRVDSVSTDRREVFLVEMRSLGNVLIRGWYSRPTAPGTYPAVLQVQGYSSTMLPTYVDYGDDLIGFGLNIRGHGNSKDNVDPGFPGYILHSLNDKEMYIYRGAYMDCIRAVDFLFSRPELDTTRLAVEGASQGGALAFATAALDNQRIKVCAPQVPFLSDFEDYFKTAFWPGNEFIDLVENQQKMTWEEVFYTLSYIDIKNLAGWIMAPMIMGVGLKDEVCPPHINFAAYNQVNTEKEYIIYPDAGHGLPQDFYFRKMAFIRHHFGLE